MRPSYQARGCWVVPKEALGLLGMELSQGSGVRSAPISASQSFYAPELGFPIWQVGRLLASRTPGVGRRAESRAAESAQDTRAGISAEWAPAPQGPPSRCAARPPRRPQGPPRLHAAVRGSVARRTRAASGRERGAERAGLRGAGSTGRAGARDARGGPGGARFPSPAAPSASRRDVTGRPPAPRSAGQSACGRRAHGPAGRAARSGLVCREQRGAASEDGPRYPPEAPQWISTRKGCWRPR